ncbi:dipeptide/oligopeptide/nickel ABC transporter permease/ATP-binding protein [Paenarthrobacter sp. NPDC089675]|uniref:dipeptide/oligopeptide/nickel ABC transporter permease/ATP-binding protein n=1 Tax=Paenarthrobacter sp. NPDC089675 TaxID=3364376 RepID=UPI003801E3B3
MSPYNPTTNSLTSLLQLPSGQHLLGTDQLGRDVLTRLLYGGQLTFIGVAQAVLTALVIGLPLGILSGYHGKFLDAAVSRIVDVMLSIPHIVILLMVFAIYGSNQTAAMLALGVLYSPKIIRIARATTFSTREELFVAAARVSGLKPSQIMVRHILPRISGPVIVIMSVITASALLVQTGLSFLGLGVELPNPSWGGMVAEGAVVLRQQPWLILPSGIAITLTVLAFVLLGDSIRDVSQDSRSSTVLKLSTDRRSTQHLAPAARDATTPPSTDATLILTEVSIDLPLRTGWTTVVDKVSFHVAPGETLGLVGESGCGKSVTALGLLGLVPGGGRVSGGTITFEGHDLGSLAERELKKIRGRGIGFVSQEPMVSLDPSYTVGKQLAEAVHQHEGGTKQAISKRVLQLLEQTGIPSPEVVSRKYPHQISGGMAQRVVIARALAGRPKLLIADEPTTALDSTVQREIMGLLRRIQLETGMAMILVTHDWGVVAETCDRAVVMYAGQVIEQGHVRDLFKDVAHPYTYALLKANPHLAEEGQRLTTIEGTVPRPDNWPLGCRFADRCAFKTESCTAAPVPLLLAEPDHLSRCIHIDELRTETK